MIRVAIGEDHKLFVDGLEELFRHVSDVEIAAVFYSGQEAISNFDLVEADIVLLDLKLPDLHGDEIIEYLKEYRPEIKVIILSMYDGLRAVQRCLFNNVKGYLLKNLEFNELVIGIREVYTGGTYYCKEVEHTLAMAIETKLTPVKMTKREFEIARLISNGRTSAEVASQLDITEQTLLTHQQNILTKYNAKSFPELISILQEQGLL